MCIFDLIATSCIHRYQLGLTSQETLFVSLFVSASHPSHHNLIWFSFSPDLNPSVSLRISQIFILHIIWLAQHIFPTQSIFYPFLSPFVCLGKWLLLNPSHDLLLLEVTLLLSDCMWPFEWMLRHFPAVAVVTMDQTCFDFGPTSKESVFTSVCNINVMDLSIEQLYVIAPAMTHTDTHTDPRTRVSQCWFCWLQ